MGHGDPELGRRILQTFLQKAIAIQGLEAICFYNAGVRLLAAESPVLAELRELEGRGVELMPCGTCIQAFGLEPQAGEVSDMDAIVRELSAAEKVVTL